MAKATLAAALLMLVSGCVESGPSSQDIVTLSLNGMEIRVDPKDAVIVVTNVSGAVARNLCRHGNCPVLLSYVDVQLRDRHGARRSMGLGRRRTPTGLLSRCYLAANTPPSFLQSPLAQRSLGNAFPDESHFDAVKRGPDLIASRDALAYGPLPA